MVLLLDLLLHLPLLMGKQLELILGMELLVMELLVL